MGLMNFLFGGGKSTQQTSQNQSTTGTNTTTPTFDPRFSPLLQTLLNRTSSQFNRGSYLPQGFETNAVQQINDANRGAQTSLNASLAARGLGTSPVAASALGGLEQQRAAQIGQLGVQMPMLERQMQQEDLANLMATLGLGRGQTSNMTGTMTGTSNTVGQQPSGGIASLLGMLYGSGAFSPNIMRGGI